MHSNPNIPDNRKSFQEKLSKGQSAQASWSAFEKDAFEGWKSSNTSPDVLSKVDDKFMPKKTPYIYIGIFSALFILSLLLFLNLNETKKVVRNTIQKQPEINTSNTKSIKQDTLQNTHSKYSKVKTIKIVKPHQIIAQQAELKIEQKNPENEIVYLPIRKGTSIENTDERKYLLAKEVYYYDMKLIDYREYRSANENTLKNFQLSGLPADKEKYSNDDENETPKAYVVTYSDYLKKTMELFKKEKYEVTSKRFEIILNAYPNDLNASFYGGLSYYNLGQYTKAYTFFQNAISIGMSNFNEEAEWYSAKSLLESGETIKAKDLLKKIVSQKGFYAKQAEKLVSSL